MVTLQGKVDEIEIAIDLDVDFHFADFNFETHED